MLDKGRRVCAIHVLERARTVAEEHAEETAKAADANSALIDSFFAAMHAAGNPGLTKIWYRDMVRMTHIKWLTKPQWQAWILDTVTWDAYELDSKVNKSAYVAVCPDRTWLDIGGGPWKGRWAGEIAEDNPLLSKIRYIFRWELEYGTAVALLQQCAQRNGVQMTGPP